LVQGFFVLLGSAMFLSFIKIKHLVIPEAKEKAIRHPRIDVMEKPVKLSELRLKNMVFLSCAVHCVLLALFFFIPGHQNRSPLNPLDCSTLVTIVNLNEMPGGENCKAISPSTGTKKEEAPNTPPIAQQPKKKTTAGKKPSVSIVSEKPPAPRKENVVSTFSDPVTTFQEVSPETSTVTDSGNNANSKLSGNFAVGSNEALALKNGSGGQGVGSGPGGRGRGSGGGVAGDTYLMIVRAKIEQHKIYPRGAKLRQIKGTVVIHFIITLEGIIKGVDVAQSSGFTVLDQAGLKAVKDASPFPKPPKDFFQTPVSIEVPIVFELI
jgi:TonB family protein